MKLHSKMCCLIKDEMTTFKRVNGYLKYQRKKSQPPIKINKNTKRGINKFILIIK